MSSSFTISRENKKMSIYYRALEKPEPKTLLTECIDTRFARASRQFSENELYINRDEDIIMRIAGGLTPLAHPIEMPSRFKYLKKQISFKCEKFPSIERIVVIGHQDCAYYTQVPDSIGSCCYKNGDKRRNGDMALRDLPLIGSFLKVIFPQKDIELYYAKLVNNNRSIMYEPIPCGPKEFATSIIDEWHKKREKVLS